MPLLRRSAAGRIVNMSSGLGSLTLGSDPGYEFANYNLITYQSSKTALNAITVAYAKELREAGIKVNAADPGFTATACQAIGTHLVPFLPDAAARITRQCAPDEARLLPSPAPLLPRIAPPVPATAPAAPQLDLPGPGDPRASH
jgi:NAD(P)-dependent dehydrogenase (short-subunit alcohol dehydrogenase family)